MGDRIKTLVTAERFIAQIQQLTLEKNWWWTDPLVNITLEEEICYEWWYHTRKLTIYVYDLTVQYIKVWGADIENEMEDGSICNIQDLTDLWVCLIKCQNQ
jgi:hypothetical protein